MDNPETTEKRSWRESDRSQKNQFDASKRVQQRRLDLSLVGRARLFGGYTGDAVEVRFLQIQQMNTMCPKREGEGNKSRSELFGRKRIEWERRKRHTIKIK